MGVDGVIEDGVADEEEVAAKKPEARRIADLQLLLQSIDVVAAEAWARQAMAALLKERKKERRSEEGRRRTWFDGLVAQPRKLLTSLCSGNRR